jgi:hypothetical protein
VGLAAVEVNSPPDPHTFREHYLSGGALAAFAARKSDWLSS